MLYISSPTMEDQVGELFIAAILARPELYYLAHPEYKNTELKNRVYKNIGKEFGMTGKLKLYCCVRRMGQVREIGKRKHYLTFETLSIV